MNELTPKEPGAPADFNPNAITREEMLKLRDQNSQREMGHQAVVNLSGDTARVEQFKRESEARGGSPYFPPTPHESEQQQ